MAKVEKSCTSYSPGMQINPRLIFMIWIKKRFQCLSSFAWWSSKTNLFMETVFFSKWHVLSDCLACNIVWHLCFGSWSSILGYLKEPVSSPWVGISEPRTCHKINTCLTFDNILGCTIIIEFHRTRNKNPVNHFLLNSPL